MEGVAGKPDEVAAGVHVERDGLGGIGAEGEGESVVAAGGEREGDLAAVVGAGVAAEVVEAGGGAGGGGFEEVRGGVELGWGE